MIKYVPENKYFNWIIPDDVKPEHWQQILENVPYEELCKFFNNNPAINYYIQEQIKC